MPFSPMHLLSPNRRVTWFGFEETLWGGYTRTIKAIILSLHKHENVKLNIRVFFEGRLAPNCFVAFCSCIKEGERIAH